MSPSRWRELFSEGQRIGISFILLAGGEPLLNRPVLEEASRLKRGFFPVFTNGVLLDDEYASFFAHHRHLLPIVSLEGNAGLTDTRRGPGIQIMVEAAMARLKKKQVFFGASITVTRENLSVISSNSFCSDLISKGCRVMIFVEYVPVTDNEPHLAPGDPERLFLENRLELLCRLFPDLLMISFPGDEKEMGCCLAAGRGFFHISSSGCAEPCPFSLYSDTNLVTDSLVSALESPLFRKLHDTGLLSGAHTGGCHLFEHDDDVRKLLAHAKHNLRTKN